MKLLEKEIINEFLSNSIYRMQENTDRIKICLDKLSEEEVWQKSNKSCNSIGNLLLHLCGNIEQYAISSLSNTEDNRDRDKEFSIKTGYNKEQLYNKLVQILEKAQAIIKNISGENLIEIREVQGFTFSGIGIIIHVVEHYSYHTGQISLWTKILKNKSLGFYDGVDLNVKNKN
jgi:uncharacterized damage-inducible protein DinB